MRTTEIRTKKKQRLRNRKRVGPHEQRSAHDEIKAPPMPEHLKRILQRYRTSNVMKASWQIVNTLVPYAMAWCGAWYLYNVNYWASLACSVLIGCFMLRIFVLHHDCTHGSFFKTRRANEIWGFLLGTLVLTPFHRWRRSHNYHHAHSGDLDHRGEGYITLYTLREYRRLTDSQKFWYRMYRQPWFLLIVGPCIQFMVLERFTFDLPKSAKVARHGVWKTNLLLAAIVGTVGMIGGWGALVQFGIILFPACVVASVIGVWLFFVQHNYDQAYFQPHEQWNFAEAALKGSSFYDLPQIMHWFTGNIGFHHIHHLDSLVPNYNLQACHYENPEFQTPYRITLWNSRHCLGLDLWDEKKQRLVPFPVAI
jgi:acyl-lipid omega-6 desaturase (Delta-12 desaturase)